MGAVGLLPTNLPQLTAGDPAPWPQNLPVPLTVTLNRQRGSCPAEGGHCGLALLSPAPSSSPGRLLETSLPGPGASCGQTVPGACPRATCPPSRRASAAPSALRRPALSPPYFRSPPPPSGCFPSAAFHVLSLTLFLHRPPQVQAARLPVRPLSRPRVPSRAFGTTPRGVRTAG